ncbi:MAG: HD-GYP domain-containing protein [Pseudomonadota bacterium]
MTEQKMKLEGLQIGMYVSRIDRPWSDLPVIMEGLLIQKNDDIDLLKKYCKYIYIDTSRGRVASPMYWLDVIKEDKIKEIVDRGNNEFTLLRKKEYQVSSSLGDELDIAKDLYRNINDCLGETFTELRLNKKFNLERLHESITTTVDSVIRNPTAFKLVIELKQSDEYYYNHALRTSVWCTQFGRHLGFSQQDINELALGGMLLDVGKTQISTELLNKKESLSQTDIAVFHAHVDTGLHLLADSGGVPYSVMQMVATHHERADTSGYPQRLENDDIPVYGRIAGIVDSYDAMTCDRPYRERPYSPHEAINDLYKLRGSAFHKDLVEQFIQTVGVYPAGSLVELHSGEIAMVVAINQQARLRPKVMVVLDENKKNLVKYFPLDLLHQKDFSIRRALDHSAYGIKMNELFLENICDFFG